MYIELLISILMLVTILRVFYRNNSPSLSYLTCSPAIQCTPPSPSCPPGSAPCPLSPSCPPGSAPCPLSPSCPPGSSPSPSCPPGSSPCPFCPPGSAPCPLSPSCPPGSAPCAFCAPGRAPCPLSPSCPPGSAPCPLSPSCPPGSAPCPLSPSCPPGSAPCPLSPSCPPGSAPCPLSPSCPPGSAPCPLSPSCPPGSAPCAFCAPGRAPCPLSPSCPPGSAPCPLSPSCPPGSAPCPLSPSCPPGSAPCPLSPSCPPGSAPCPLSPACSPAIACPPSPLEQPHGWLILDPEYDDEDHWSPASSINNFTHAYVVRKPIHKSGNTNMEIGFGSQNPNQWTFEQHGDKFRIKHIDQDYLSYGMYGDERILGFSPAPTMQKYNNYDWQKHYGIPEGEYDSTLWNRYHGTNNEAYRWTPQTKPNYCLSATLGPNPDPGPQNRYLLGLHDCVNYDSCTAPNPCSNPLDLPQKIIPTNSFIETFNLL